MSNTKDYSLLIVDDDQDICSIYQQYCEDLGCFKQIAFANDGIAARDLLREKKFDLIILDMQLPKLSGIDIIKGEFSDTALNKIENVLVLSAYLLELNLIGILLENGVAHYIAKPIAEDIFKVRVQKMISEHP